MRDRRRLLDIIGCAEELASYLDGITEDAFASDRLRQRAVERLLTIIGEAAKQLSDETRAEIEQPWREIMRFRDKGIHAYDSLSPRTLYRISVEFVPDLADALRKHMAG